MDILLWLSSIKQSFKWASPIFYKSRNKIYFKDWFCVAWLKIVVMWYDLFLIDVICTQLKMGIKIYLCVSSRTYPLSLKRWFLSSVHRNVIIIDGHLTRDVIDLWNAIQVIMVQSHWFTDNQMYIKQWYIFDDLSIINSKFLPLWFFMYKIDVYLFLV